jgi:serine/threonine protein kinase/formylglycine-generating enzyme required for sulfatase activity
VTDEVPPGEAARSGGAAAAEGRTNPETTPVGPKVLRDRYRVVRRVGFGGMGAVYVGTDDILGRPVAIKELRHEYAADEVLRKRFLREARAAGSLVHPNIVTVFDFVEEKNTLFIVMEYLDGGTLLDSMNAAEDRKLDVAYAIAAGRDALLGLEAAHEAGFVHRDIKPGNILFDSKGRAKIGDFGVVRGKVDDDVTQLTSGGGHPGTLVYMAPEQIDGAEVEGRSDVYAMAAVLYEAIAGVRYFERPGVRKTERALMDAICEAPPVPLRDVAPWVPPDVEAIIIRALAKDLRQRPSARELSDLLGKLLAAPRARPSISAPGESGERRRLPPEALQAPTDPYGETAASGSSAGRVEALGPMAPGPSSETVPRPGRSKTDRHSRPPGTGRVQPATSALPPLVDLPADRAGLAQERTSATSLGSPSVVVGPASGPDSGRLPRRAKDGAPIVRIPAGAFTLGGDAASDELPPRRVTLDAFTIDRAPVTVAQYRRFLAGIAQDGPPRHPLLQALFPQGKDHRPARWDTREFSEAAPTPEHPIVLVDWFDAVGYATWAGARLPTEAEWERVARGPDGRARPWGPGALDATRAVYGRTTRGPEPVGARPAGASAEGVLDLLGNVWEWTADRYDARAYATLPAHAPHLPVSLDGAPLLRMRAVKRGGSWTNAAHTIRTSKRGFEYLLVRRDNLGFRCAGP